MLVYEILVFLVLCLPGVVLNKIPIKFGAILPEILTFDTRSFRSAIFRTYLNARKDRRSNFYKYFDFNQDGIRVAMSHFSPQEILEAFCNDILGNDMNTVIIVNNPYLLGRHQALEGYVFQLAASLGLPVLSWNAQHSVADKVSEESLILEFAPSIDHQVQAILALLKQYDWPAFSIVTTTLSGYKDFLNLLRQKTRTTKHWYDIDDGGTDIQRRFEILYELTLTSNSQSYLQRQLQKVKHSDTRIILLYASMKEARDIMEAAHNVSLTDSRYMWIVTQATVEKLERKAPSVFPRGMLGIQFNADESAMSALITSASQLWVNAMKRVADEGPPRGLLNTIKPNISCSASFPLKWQDGANFFQYLKNATVQPRNRKLPEISFDEHGVLRNTMLNITNLKTDGYWHEIGTWDKNGLILNDISWPGGKKSPPSGKPKKYHLRVMTLKEDPYVRYYDPEPDGSCGKTKAFKCETWVRHGKPGTDSYYTNGTVTKCCTGLAIDLLGLLNQSLGFDFTLFDVEDGLWGSENRETKEWNGLVRALMDDKADIVVTSLKITPERNRKVEFSVPYLETGITIIVAIRDGAISATAFLEPFDFTSWILILLLCIHVVSVVVFIFEYTSPSGLNKGINDGEPYDFPSWCLILVFSVHAIGASIFIFEWLSPQGLNQGKTPMRGLAPKNPSEHKFSLFRSFWLIWSMLFQATVTVDNPRGVSSRFLANVWALFALVFLASYTANLAAFMITKEEYYDLTGITDLRLKNPYMTKPPFRFATLPHGSTESNLFNNYYDIWAYMRKFNKSSVDEGIEAVKKNTIDAFIYDATVLEYWAGKDKDCKLRTVGDWYARTGYGVALPFGSKWLEPINNVILQLQADGELDRLQRFWMKGACSKTKKKGEKSHKLGIPNFTSAFILLLVGMLLGAILLTVEHSYFKFGRGCLRKWDKCGCCGLVSLSMGKSLTFEQSVMEAIAFHKTHKCKDVRCETELWKARHELDLALLKIDRLQETMANNGLKTDRRAIWRLDNSEHDERRSNRRALQPNGMTRGELDQLPNDDIVSAESFEGLDGNRGSPKKLDFTSDTWPVRRSPSYTSAMLGAERTKSPTKVRYHNGNYYVEVDGNMEMETVL